MMPSARVSAELCTALLAAAFSAGPADAGLESQITVPVVNQSGALAGPPYFDGLTFIGSYFTAVPAKRFDPFSRSDLGPADFGSFQPPPSVAVFIARPVELSPAETLKTTARNRLLSGPPDYLAAPSDEVQRAPASDPSHAASFSPISFHFAQQLSPQPAAAESGAVTHISVDVPIELTARIGTSRVPPPFESEYAATPAATLSPPAPEGLTPEQQYILFVVTPAIAILGALGIAMFVRRRINEGW